VQNIVAAPQQWAKKGITVPSSSLGDFDAKNGAEVGGGRGDNFTSGSGNIRTGGPGGTGLIRIGTGIVGDGHILDSISMHFRYTAGYTPAPGQQKAAPTVTLQVLDMKTDAVLKSVWTSQQLGNFSWDNFKGYSPRIPVQATGLGIKLSSDSPVILALSVENNERNLQIPIDDKADGFGIKVGFDWLAYQRHDAHGDHHEPVERFSGFGLAPYYGPGVPFGSGQIWAKKQPHGGMAVLLINHGGKLIDGHTIDLKTTLNLTAPSYTARDVWAHKDLGTVPEAKLSLSVFPYDSAFVLLTPSAP